MEGGGGVREGGRREERECSGEVRLNPDGFISGAVQSTQNPLLNRHSSSNLISHFTLMLRCVMSI